MKLLILSPSALPAVTGNAITVERWRHSLHDLGLTIRVVSTEGLKAGELDRILAQDRPDLIHAHHLVKSGSLLLDPVLPESIRAIPLVVSPAGTDLGKAPGESPLSEAALRVCTAARAIVTQTPWIAKLLHDRLTHLRDHLVTAPKAFRWFGNDPFDLRRHFAWDREKVIFFCPAGIRPVKNNLDCLRLMESVHEAHPPVRMVFAGPALDSDYARRFEEEVRRCSAFARWIKAIPPAAMRSAYASADVVLNGSLSEGLSNTLLEGIAAGKPLLASRIPANEWTLAEYKGDGPCGVLFDLDNPGDFFDKATALADDEGLRAELARACRDGAARIPSPLDEAAALVRIYRHVLEQKHPAAMSL